MAFKRSGVQIPYPPLGCASDESEIADGQKDDISPPVFIRPRTARPIAVMV
jgi:hypothetical protein